MSVPVRRTVRYLEKPVGTALSLTIQLQELEEGIGTLLHYVRMEGIALDHMRNLFSLQ